jgi:1,2-diacylglycerol 3-beta-galactosyltransferase
MITIFGILCIVGLAYANRWQHNGGGKIVNCGQNSAAVEISSPSARKFSNKHVDDFLDKCASAKQKIEGHLKEKTSLNKLSKSEKIVITTTQAYEIKPKGQRGFLTSLVNYRGGSKKNKKKRVLILMSDTGGGHRASAKALDKAISEQVPGKIDVSVMDIWTEHAKWPFNNFVPYYRFLAKHPLLWRGMYLFGNFPPTKLFTEMWSWYSCYPSFRNAIMQEDPDLVVSVHPLCQLMPISAVKEMNKMRDPEKLKIPFVTVVTDLGGAHSTWFDRRTDAIFIPGEAVRKLALKNNVQPDKIIMRGLPIRPAFWKPSKAKYKLRKQLDLTQHVKTVLLMGGGDGVGGIDAIATRIASRLGQSSQKAQVVVICGNNAQTCSALKGKKWPQNVRMVPKGFCENIDEYMAASDLLVTKAGPGTIAEAMIQGLPCVLSSFLPGQVSDQFLA